MLATKEGKEKFFHLLPFQIESRFTHKSYVLQLELFPEAKYLRMKTLKLNGVHEVYMPIDEIIPITKYDYWCASWHCFMKQSPTLDLDMIYASQLTKEMFVFDKTGDWKDEGVYHEALNMENTFMETNWYDEFNPHNF